MLFYTASQEQGLPVESFCLVKLFYVHHVFETPYTQLLFLFLPAHVFSLTHCRVKLLLAPGRWLLFQFGHKWRNCVVRVVLQIFEIGHDSNRLPAPPPTPAAEERLLILPRAAVKNATSPVKQSLGSWLWQNEAVEQVMGVGVTWCWCHCKQKRCLILKSLGWCSVCFVVNQCTSYLSGCFCIYKTWFQTNYVIRGTVTCWKIPFFFAYQWSHLTLLDKVNKCMIVEFKVIHLYWNQARETGR